MVGFLLSFFSFKAGDLALLVEYGCYDWKSDWIGLDWIGLDWIGLD